MTALTGVLAGQVLGKGLALLYFTIKDLFAKRQALSVTTLEGPNVIFFDKQFIANLVRQ